MMRSSVLIDINHFPGLVHVTDASGACVRIDVLTRHYTLEISPTIKDRCPILQEAITHVSHVAIRNRGTIGGSLSHADPAAELPMLAMLLDAQLAIRDTDRSRVLTAADFFLGPLTTALDDD